MGRSYEKIARRPIYGLKTKAVERRPAERASVLPHLFAAITWSISLRSNVTGRTMRPARSNVKPIVYARRKVLFQAFQHGASRSWPCCCWLAGGFTFDGVGRHRLSSTSFRNSKHGSRMAGGPCFFAQRREPALPSSKAYSCPSTSVGLGCPTLVHRWTVVFHRTGE